MDQIRPSFIVAVILGVAGPALGAEGVDWHGFLQASYAARATGAKGPASGDFLLGEERLQIAVSGSTPSVPGSFLGKADFFHDAVTGKADLEIREAHADYATDLLELRLGRQIITWGTGDLLFVNDVFPKDWTALFSGKPIEYLKLGSDAMKANIYAQGFTVEAVAIPFFEPDRLPSSDRFIFFDPFAQVTQRTLAKPRGDIGNVETAVKIAHPAGRWDTALYAYRGFYRSPSMVPDNFVAPTQLTMRFPRLAVYGFSAQGPALGGVVALEGGYYDSIENQGGSNPLDPNPQAVHLLGYQRQLSEDLTAGVQYYGEYMMHYGRYLSNLPAGLPKRDEWRQLLTMRLTKLLRYQTWKLSLFGYWSPTDQDYYLIPEVRHSLSDALWVAVGGNVFGGASRTTFFGQFEKDSNLYVNARYEF